MLYRRPYIRPEWCGRIIAPPLHRAVQPDGRIRCWGVVPEMGGRVLRVALLPDGKTVLNAFPDRNFRLPTVEPEDKP